MAWCQSGDEPLSEPIVAKSTDSYMRHICVILSIHLLSWLHTQEVHDLNVING